MPKKKEMTPEQTDNTAAVAAAPSDDFQSELIERSKMKGTITAAEVLDIIDDGDCPVDKLFKAYETLESSGIEVTNDLDNTVFDIPEDEISELEEEIDENPEDVTLFREQVDALRQFPAPDVRQFLLVGLQLPVHTFGKESHFAYLIAMIARLTAS